MQIAYCADSHKGHSIGMISKLQVCLNNYLSTVCKQVCAMDGIYTIQ